MKEKPVLRVWTGTNGKIMLTVKFTVDGNLFEKTMKQFDASGVYLDFSELMNDLLRKWLESLGIKLFEQDIHK